MFEKFFAKFDQFRSKEYLIKKYTVKLASYFVEPENQSKVDATKNNKKKLLAIINDINTCIQLGILEQINGNIFDKVVSTQVGVEYAFNYFLLYADEAASLAVLKKASGECFRTVFEQQFKDGNNLLLRFFEPRCCDDLIKWGFPRGGRVVKQYSWAYMKKVMSMLCTDDAEVNKLLQTQIFKEIFYQKKDTALASAMEQAQIIFSDTAPSSAMVTQLLEQCISCSCSHWIEINTRMFYSAASSKAISWQDMFEEIKKKGKIFMEGLFSSSTPRLFRIAILCAIFEKIKLEEDFAQVYTLFDYTFPLSWWQRLRGKSPKSINVIDALLDSRVTRFRFKLDGPDASDLIQRIAQHAPLAVLDKYFTRNHANGGDIIRSGNRTRLTRFFQVLGNRLISLEPTTQEQGKKLVSAQVFLKALAGMARNLILANEQTAVSDLKQELVVKHALQLILRYGNHLETKRDGSDGIEDSDFYWIKKLCDLRQDTTIKYLTDADCSTHGMKFSWRSNNKFLKQIMFTRLSISKRLSTGKILVAGLLNKSAEEKQIESKTCQIIRCTKDTMPNWQQLNIIASEGPNKLIIYKNNQGYFILDLSRPRYRSYRKISNSKNVEQVRAIFESHAPLLCGKLQDITDAGHKKTMVKMANSYWDASLGKLKNGSKQIPWCSLRPVSTIKYQYDDEWTSESEKNKIQIMEKCSERILQQRTEEYTGNDMTYPCDLYF